MISLGLAVALAAVFLFPEWAGPRRRVVEVREEPRPTSQGAVAPRSSYAEAVARAAPAVVNIFTSKRVVREVHPLAEDPLYQPFFKSPGFAPRLEQQTSLGSGVIVSPQGYLLTNNHVVAGAEQIAMILPDGQQLEAKAIGADVETDLAVLKVDSPALPTVTIASSENLRVGDVVLAIGNPFGVGQTVTLGIVSATGRNQLGLNTFEDFIQTDAAINPGSSGGALINAEGELIGISTAIFTRSGGSQGIGFAIPVNLARDVMQQIIEHGSVVRGWLGVEGIDVPADVASNLKLPARRGVLVTNTIPDGPAAKAGIRAGDLIIAIGGREIEGARMVLNLIAQSTPGTELAIKGLRNGTPFTIRATVSVRPIAPANPRPAANGR